MTHSGLVLMTGATGLIGQAAVKHLLAEDYQVICISRSQERLETLKQAMDTPALIGLPLDLMAPDMSAQLLTALEHQELYPEIFIHNARDASYLATGGQSPSRMQWVSEFTLDVVVAYEVTEALLQLPQTRLRSVICVSSMYGLVAPQMSLYTSPSDVPPVHYGVAKSAQIHLVREMAVRFAVQGVRVNAVSFGGVKGRAPESFQARYAEKCPQGHMLEVSQCVGALSFLASESASGMTGHNLIVDGGWTAW